jgi:hypothetical protein
MRKTLERHLRAQAEVRGARLTVRPWGGLILAEAADDDRLAIEDAFSHSFGLVAADPATSLPLNPAAVAEAAVVDEPGAGATFAVRCRRHGQKGEWNSQTFAGAVGAEVLQRAPHLKVNLSNPDWEVKVALMTEEAFLLEERVVCPGGLPTGVQGTVRAKLKTERDYLAAYLVMRRGCRILPDSNADPKLVRALADWDPALLAEGKSEGGTSASGEEWSERLQTSPGPGHDGKIWAVVGDDLSDFVDEDEGRVPYARLEPLVGWSDDAILELKLRAGVV